MEAVHESVRAPSHGETPRIASLVATGGWVGVDGAIERNLGLAPGIIWEMPPESRTREGVGGWSIKGPSDSGVGKIDPITLGVYVLFAELNGGFNGLRARYCFRQLRGMSWNQYAQLLTAIPEGHGRCSYSAIHGIDDGSCWGLDPPGGPKNEWLNLTKKGRVEQVTSLEVRNIIKAFNDPSTLYSTGILIRGQKFIYLRTEGDALLGRRGNQGCIAVRTNKGTSVPAILLYDSYYVLYWLQRPYVLVRVNSPTL
ncbi:hypothetical protein LAZ67_15002548 [Cordylochernes scorpioides]|uniref:Profilin n=1 Tax=Cordylochernes scorpioides TaxID=51811 RepID=A0ABY6LBN6_9ARAC|nr:hypothetical protein LAZ67_15002548 [Cordylochernes scorpioides]